MKREVGEELGIRLPDLHGRCGSFYVDGQHKIYIAYFTFEELYDKVIRHFPPNGYLPWDRTDHELDWWKIVKFEDLANYPLRGGCYGAFKRVVRYIL